MLNFRFIFRLVFNKHKMNYTPKFIFLALFILLFSCKSEKKEKKYTIGFSQCTNADLWRRTMQDGMERELSLNPDVRFIMKDAKGQSAIQYKQIQELIKDGIDILIVSPNEVEPISTLVNQVYDSGIPVVVVDRRTNSSKYTAFVGADNFEVGQNAGIYAALALKGNGNIIEVTGLLGASPVIDRHNGFMSAIQKYPNIHFLEQINGDWEKKNFSETVETALKSNQNINFIFAQNDGMGYDVYNVCKKLGLENKIKVIGIDGLIGENAGLELVEKGILKATILYPTGGEEAINTAIKILKKEPHSKENKLFTTVIDSTNVRMVQLQGEKLYNQQRDIKRQNESITQLTTTYSTLRYILISTISLLVLSGIFGAFVLYLLREKQVSNRLLTKQNNEILEQKNKIEEVSEQVRKVNEEKLRFYSYISHEFRTPLSLIISPVEDLLNQKSPSIKDVRQNIAFVQKNANRLKNLVDQLLDLRKVDAGKLNLRFTENDLIPFLKDIIDDFKPNAEKKHIGLQFITEVKALKIWFDFEKLDKVFYNLLANAFKYTPQGGKISVKLGLKDGKVEVSVEDNGVGMSEEEKKRVFDLFYSGTGHYNFGTGIGLALAREFMLLQHGSIEVESEKNAGSIFKVYLQLGSEHLKPEEMDFSKIDLAHISVPSDIQIDEKNSIASLSHNNTIVVIEDDEDMSAFLKKLLSKNYDIISADSAEKGWISVLEVIPDLIISDVMLPGMSGIQLTEKIKSDFRTSHVPIILLTAKGQMESKIEGTKAGADAYLEKPFNLKYLDEIIKSLLANREKMRARFSSDIASSQLSNRSERRFLIELEHLIEQHLSDSDFTVEKLSKDMGMSRMQLYRKVLALTNSNISDYISDIRINKAKLLLQDSNKNIAEVAYESGFSNPNYFTTSFKLKTGKTPTEFRKQ